MIRMKSFHPFITLTAALALNLCAHAEDSAKPSPDNKKTEDQAFKETQPVSKNAEITIDGKKIPYEVTAAKIILKDDDDKPKASIFYTSYLRTGVKDSVSRPVLFAFNGGPGSSAVWLHIGMLGPRVLDLPGDGTQAPKPPVTLKDNPFSILDVCDLIFVDPVSTGYSRAEKDTKAKEFHGLNADIESVGDFVRKWITENDRWASPKYLLGESYGGIRVAGLSKHLQSRYGMSLNGVVLLSALLDFRTLQNDQGSDLAYSIFLPTFATTAHYHKKVTGDRDKLIKDVTEFAYGDYTQALTQGNAINQETKEDIASRLETFTSISKDTWVKNHLRITASQFRAELLSDKNIVLGRFDARVAWAATSNNTTYASYDPSFSLAKGAFSTAMLDYLGREIGYKEEQPYEIITGKVHPWNWNSNNRIANVSDRLESALRDNPKLKVLVMAGYTDLATPPESVAYSVRHMLELPDATKENISTVYYEGGHMFYTNPDDLKKSREDLLKFFEN